MSIESNRRSRKRRLWRKPRVELLDERTLLDAGGISAFMSLSFVPDGTAISSQQSRLFESFDQVAPSSEWQQSIESAFRNWAIHTNADIATVSDSGDPLGIPGRREADSRFGDVRVAAAPLTDSVMAISFPRDNPALGTWSSDIIFNSNASWESIDQIAAITLHEAGHIFGLSHSDDVNSAMHSHGASSVLQPSATDIANLQFLFGNRSLDPNEDDDEEGSNDDLESATNLADNLGGDGLVVSYGDISTENDSDVFRIATEDELEDGVVYIEVQANGLSTLSPVVELLDEDGEILESVKAEGGIARLIYELDDIDELYLSVRAGEDGDSKIGRYVIAAAVMEEEFDDDEHEELLDGGLFSLRREILEQYLRNPDDEPLFDDEDDFNDDFPNAQLLLPTSTNAGRTWYEQLGSISAGSDSDIYLIESPDDTEGVQNIMTLNVQSLTPRGLIPRVSVYNEDGDPIETEVVVNGNGELVAQTLEMFDVDSEDTFFVEVHAAHPNGLFAHGNYRLTVNYGSDFVEMTEFSSGMLTAESPVQLRELHIASPQLMHFLLEAESSSEEVVVTMDMFDESENRVYSLATQAGQPRSGANPLLAPGTYTVRFELSGNYPADTSSTFSLAGVAESNPLGVVPVDPTNEPVFQCEGTSDQFCYPGGTTSDSPFFWDEFIKDTPDPSPFTPFPVSDAEAFWWDWYFENSQTNDSPPTTLEDTFRVRNGDLTVPVVNGVLSNDRSNANGPLIARVHTGPTNGTLDIAENGSFRYVPNPGFFGTDTFSYQAFDNKPSLPTAVMIQVSRPGDVDDDGQVAFADFLIFARNFNANQVGWANGDFDGDGRVSFEDFLLLADNFGTTS